MAPFIKNTMFIVSKKINNSLVFFTALLLFETSKKVRIKYSEKEERKSKLVKLKDYSKRFYLLSFQNSEILVTKSEINKLTKIDKRNGKAQ